VLREVLEQLELLESELERATTELGGVGCLIHRQVTGADDAGFRSAAGRRHPADRQPEPRLDLGWAGRVENDIIDTPVGRDRSQATFSDEGKERGCEASGSQKPTQAPGDDEFTATVHDDHIDRWSVEQRAGFEW
jgi:hypothetical protein